ncbi:MAG: hypothetical protein H6Q89_5056, partial [Myxococcaceae bacterium]|nr:hypothetical protein [Myxococcaceae bacterium]
MPTLSSFFAIFTDGTPPRGDMIVPPGTFVALDPIPQVPPFSADDELFGPHAQPFVRAPKKHGWLLTITRDVKGSAGTFFADAHKLLLHASKGLTGWGIDVLRLWPFPLHKADELPEDPFAEDLFSVGFAEQGEHGFRAETVGLAKLQQRELSFEFYGKDLLEDAALLCAHLADWAMGQGRRVGHEQTMAYGFDRLLFRAIEGVGAGGPFRGWHPPVIQRLLPEQVFKGVGVVQVYTYASAGNEPVIDLSTTLRRALEQRMVLEGENLTGESPHQSALAEACACAGGPDGLKGVRHEPRSQKD